MKRGVETPKPDWWACLDGNLVFFKCATSAKTTLAWHRREATSFMWACRPKRLAPANIRRAHNRGQETAPKTSEEAQEEATRPDAVDEGGSDEEEEMATNVAWLIVEFNPCRVQSVKA